MTNPIKPATDADLVTFRQWNRSMLTHPYLMVSTVVERLLSRIEADRATIAARDAELERLTDELAQAMVPDDHEAEERAVLHAEILRLEDVIVWRINHDGVGQWEIRVWDEARSILARRDREGR